MWKLVERSRVVRGGEFIPGDTLKGYCKQEK